MLCLAYHRDGHVAHEYRAFETLGVVKTDELSLHFLGVVPFGVDDERGQSFLAQHFLVSHYFL